MRRFNTKLVMDNLDEVLISPRLRWCLINLASSASDLFFRHFGTFSSAAGASGSGEVISPVTLARFTDRFARPLQHFLRFLRCWKQMSKMIMRQIATERQMSTMYGTGMARTTGFIGMHMAGEVAPGFSVVPFKTQRLQCRAAKFV